MTPAAARRRLSPSGLSMGPLNPAVSIRTRPPAAEKLQYVSYHPVPDKARAVVCPIAIVNQRFESACFPAAITLRMLSASKTHPPQVPPLAS